MLSSKVSGGYSWWALVTGVCGSVEVSRGELEEEGVWREEEWGRAWKEEDEWREQGVRLWRT